MREIRYLPVLVHSCLVRPDVIPEDKLEKSAHYIEVKKTEKSLEVVQPVKDDRGRYITTKLEEKFYAEEVEKVVAVYYMRLPKKCRCSLYVSNYQADQFVASGKATRTFKYLNRGITRDENQIWMPVVREKVPRVDLISRPDIERAVIGSERKTDFYKYNPQTKRMELQKPPEGMTLGQWLLEIEREERYERFIRRKYMGVIEETHQLYADNREKLTVPFKEDPFEGRILFPFGPDQRT